MTYNKTPEKTLKTHEKHHSDGSELIPAEVQANMRRDEDTFAEVPAVLGATVDDEGLLNNYAVEPDVYLASYPSKQQQRRYLVLGASALLFVISLVLVSLFVS